MNKQLRAWKKWAGAGLLALAAGAAQAASSVGLDVQLLPTGTLFNGQQDIAVKVTVTNRNAVPVRVLKWALPGGRDGSAFRVTRDGTLLPYQGAVYKRPAPTADDYLTLAPGASYSADVELSGLFDMTDGGHYSIEFDSFSGQLVAPASAAKTPAAIAADLAAAQPGALESTPAHVWVEYGSGPSLSAALAAEPIPETAAQAKAGAGGVSYTGACTNAQKSAIATALNSAATYASRANRYLAGMTASTQRYAKWFGTYSDTARGQVKLHYAKMVNAFNGKPLVYDCSCTDNYYAYVYPNQPYKVYVCPVFWDAPNTGTDSKAGTLIHEMSHFTVIGATDDYVYGQSGAAALAISNPARARRNADNHEYFAENTPALP
ncbi:M35 family metallo-endopeptidase [Derxia lacustris]|uniref:M35 family metallo-endopeptidase n=1 Tax=Derxia lacustris TaxID=764842 RepID=UPI000A1707CB|nr:M35 family metallo-endopeptidase [Derxia lacustris]